MQQVHLSGEDVQTDGGVNCLGTSSPTDWVTHGRLVTTTILASEPLSIFHAGGGKTLLKNSALVAFCSRGAGSRHSSSKRREDISAVVGIFFFCFNLKKIEKEQPKIRKSFFPFCCSHFTHLPKSSPQVSHHIVAQLLSRGRLGQSGGSRTASSIAPIDDFRAAFI